MTLVLTRRRNEKVILVTDSGERVEVVVIATRDDQVRLGFNASKHVTIHREEIWERIKESKRESK